MSEIRWWLVRHAPTRVRGAIGWTDIAADLSDRAALGRLRALLPRQGALVSSDLRRAVETADALGGDLIRLPHAPTLRELHFGAWEGRGFDEIGEAASRAFFADPGPATAPGGESLDMLTERVAGCIEALCADPPAADIVAICHAGAIRAALARFAGMGHRAALRLCIDPLSVTRLDRLTGGQWRVERINHRP
ncbi:MAG: histidine phosphatase family protein [Alphaproteobacteria bacterium]|nr:MAG: histidine phosphatase family protein [Alphaproteobacteria bacterium]